MESCQRLATETEEPLSQARPGATHPSGDLSPIGSLSVARETANGDKERPIRPISLARPPFALRRGPHLGKQPPYFDHRAERILIARLTEPLSPQRNRLPSHHWPNAIQQPARSPLVKHLPGEDDEDLTPFPPIYRPVPGGPTPAGPEHSRQPEAEEFVLRRRDRFPDQRWSGPRRAPHRPSRVALQPLREALPSKPAEPAPADTPPTSGTEKGVRINASCRVTSDKPQA